jgi:hypothetical protein
MLCGKRDHTGPLLLACYGRRVTATDRSCSKRLPRWFAIMGFLANQRDSIWRLSAAEQAGCAGTCGGRARAPGRDMGGTSPQAAAKRAGPVGSTHYVLLVLHRHYRAAARCGMRSNVTIGARTDRVS